VSSKVLSVLHHFHVSTYGGHIGFDKTITKVLQAGLHWPILFKDVRNFNDSSAKCYVLGNISKRHEMPQSGILEVELFNIWGIDFMGALHSSHNNLYIHDSNYVSKWLEIIASPTNDSKVVIKFL